ICSITPQAIALVELVFTSDATAEEANASMASTTKNAPLTRRRSTPRLSAAPRTALSRTVFSAEPDNVRRQRGHEARSRSRGAPEHHPAPPPTIARLDDAVEGGAQERTRHRR